MNNTFKKIEVVANLAIIAVAVLLTTVLVKRFILTTPDHNHPSIKQTQVGDKVALPDVDWSKNKSSLILVLSEGCKYCTESGPFYQRLANARTEQKDVRLIAVLPQTLVVSQKYLNTLDLAVDEIKQSPLDALGVRGTPTLMFVNNGGVVTDIWIGRLPPAKEDEVLNRMRS